MLGAGALAGCGSSTHSGGTAADPAAVTPAGAPIFLGATVRPSGAEASGALAAGDALTHQADPFMRLLVLLRTPGSPALDYATEVAPWLGPRAGVFLSSLDGAGAILTLLEAGLTGESSAASVSFGTGHADGAIVMDTSDSAAARSFLAKQANRAGARPTSYDGVPYEVTASGLAFGLVGRFAVIGSESGLRAVIETAHGGDGLAGVGRLRQAAAAAPAGAIAHLYMDPPSTSVSPSVAGSAGRRQWRAPGQRLTAGSGRAR